MDLDDDVYDEQLLQSSTSTKERWDDEQKAKLKEVVKEVMGEQSGSVSGGVRAIFEIVAERLKIHGFDRTALACSIKWKRMEEVKGKNLQTNTSSDTLREVNNSEHDETTEVESDDRTGGTPKGSKRKAVQGKPVSRTSRAWTREEERIFSDHIKARRERGKRLGLKAVMTEELFVSMVKLLEEKGYTRTLQACRCHWNVKRKEHMEMEESPENSSITVTPDTTFSTPHSTSDSSSDDDVVSDMMTTDEGIASRVKRHSAIGLSESDAQRNREESANYIESLGAQVSSEIFLDNGVEVSYDQKALLEEAFSKDDYFTTETLKDMCRTTNLASREIKTWFYKKRFAVNKEKETVLLAAKIEKDSSTSMAKLNEPEQGNSWTPKHSRTPEIININEPWGYERASSDPRPSKKARYSNGGELSTNGQGDTTDMNLNIGDKSTPVSNPTVVTATDSRQHSVEAQAQPSFLPHLEEEISTGYSPHFKGILADERSQLQRRIVLAERKQERLDEEISDHAATIDGITLARNAKIKELAQVRERLELEIASHAARIEAEKRDKARKENELRETTASRMTNMNALEILDNLCRRENIA